MTFANNSKQLCLNDNHKVKYMYSVFEFLLGPMRQELLISQLKTSCKPANLWINADARKYVIKEDGEASKEFQSKHCQVHLYW